LRRSSLLLCSSVALLALGAPPAVADEPDDVAAYQRAVARGAELFAAEDFAGARAQFERAYALHDEPLLLFNIASTYRREGDHAAAIAYYRQFLAEAPADDPRAELALETIEHLQTLLDERAQLEKARAARAARVRPAPPPVEPEPLRIRREPPRDTGGPTSDTTSALTWTGVGFTVAGIAGLGIAWLEQREAAAVEAQLEALPAGQAWDWEQQHLHERGEAAHRRALGWTIAGGALAGSGVVLYFVGRGRERAAPVAVTPTGDGASVVVSGTF
jgi:hypothetical protein